MTLRELRVNAGLRQVDVAKKLTVDQAAVSLWERGKTTPCRKYHKKLARLYGCSVEEIQAGAQMLKARQDMDAQRTDNRET